MMKYYKLYLGDYIEQGIPDNAIACGQVPKSGLKKAVQEITRQRNFEVYILTPSGDIKAYTRDKLEKFFVDKNN